MTSHRRRPSLIGRVSRALRGRLRALVLGRRGPLPSRDAYRLWAQRYDCDANVIADLDAEVFAVLLAGAPVAGAAVVDIGCGTGRHWGELLARSPRLLCGVDTSPEMLARVRDRHPQATLCLRTAHRIEAIADGSVDLIVSTLMLGYARNVGEELAEWVRCLRVGGQIVLTDLHPAALQAGAKRTFSHGGTTFEIEHHVFTYDGLLAAFRALNLEVLSREERSFRDAIKPGQTPPPYANAYPGDPAMPLVIGFRLQRGAR